MALIHIGSSTRCRLAGSSAAFGRPYARRDTIIDTHIGPIISPVWALYRYTLQRAGRLIPTLIEWDQEIPHLDDVLDEADRARELAMAALSGGSDEAR